MSKCRHFINRLNCQELKKDNIIDVILCWNYTSWGGAQIYFLSIIKNSPSNYRFTIVLPSQTKQDILDFFEPYGVKFEFLDISFQNDPKQGLVEKLKRQMQRTISEYEVYRKLKKMRLEKKILHIESAAWQSWVLLFLLSKLGNVFLTMHNALPPNVPKWRKNIWSKRLNLLLSQDKFHFFAANQNAIDSLKGYVSEELQSKLILTRATINPVEIEAVNNKKIDIREIKEKYNIPIDKFIVLCVGQFIDRKGRWVFLEAAKEILKTTKAIHFVWLSPQLPDENDTKKIKSFDLGISFCLIKSENVGKTRDEILSFFKIADVFTLPSLWEGLPIAILEAMALGLPTISTNLNAIPEAVIDEKTGILVETGNAEQLKSAILRLYENEGLRKKLAETGKEFILDKFDERKMAKIVLDNYEKCLLQ